MINNIPVALPASQLVLSRDPVPFEIQAYLPALRIANPAHVVRGPILNNFLLRIMIEEAWRTNLGRKLPKVKFLDIESLVWGRG